MQRAEPKVVEVQLNTREAKNIVKLERTLSCTGKLTSVVRGGCTQKLLTNGPLYESQSFESVTRLCFRQLRTHFRRCSLVFGRSDLKFGLLEGPRRGLEFGVSVSD